MKLGIMLEVDETFMMIWLPRSSEVRVKVRRWPQSPIGTIFVNSVNLRPSWTNDVNRSRVWRKRRKSWRWQWAFSTRRSRTHWKVKGHATPSLRRCRARWRNFNNRSTSVRSVSFRCLGNVVCVSGGSMLGPGGTGPQFLPRPPPKFFQGNLGLNFPHVWCHWFYSNFG